MSWTAISPGGLCGFNPLPKKWRRFERHHPSCRNRSFFAGLGIATNACFFPTHHEIAETGELHVLVPFEFHAHQLKHALEEVAGILLAQPDLLDEPINDICARKSILRHPASP